MSEIRGRFLWYDLMTTDAEAAQDFYTKVVGWGTQPFEGGDEPYTMWVAGERPMGGVATLSDEAVEMGAPPHWLAYIGTPDVDATVEKAKELGGKLYHGPIDMPEVGRFAVLADPQGAVFACFCPSGGADSMKSEGGHGEVSWHELNTSDWEAAFAFYSALFGWAKHEAMEMGEAGTYQMYGAEGEQPSYGGMMSHKPEAGIPPHWLYYVSVPDLEASTTMIKELGGGIMAGPMEVPGGDHIVIGTDPQGAAFALYAKG